MTTCAGISQIANRVNRDASRQLFAPTLLTIAPASQMTLEEGPLRLHCHKHGADVTPGGFDVVLLTDAGGKEKRQPSSEEVRPGSQWSLPGAHLQSDFTKHPSRAVLAREPLATTAGHKKRPIFAYFVSLFASHSSV